MEIWDKLKNPPEWALKKINAGRLSGKSDINPQWRYMVMTDTFGPCGIGWKFEIVKTWTEEGPDNQRFVFVQINLYFKHEGAWSDPIPGFGGDMVIVKESKGLYLNDEAYKMATTDALGSAMKMIGVAASVYCNFNDTKYERNQETTKQTNKQPNNQQQTATTNNITDFQKAQQEVTKQRQEERHQEKTIKWDSFWASVKVFGLDSDDVHDIAINHFGRPLESLNEVIKTQQELNKFLSVVAKHKKTA